jgi:hypothetical protein
MCSSEAEEEDPYESKRSDHGRVSLESTTVRRWQRHAGGFMNHESCISMRRSAYGSLGYYTSTLAGFEGDSGYQSLLQPNGFLQYI